MTEPDEDTQLLPRISVPTPDGWTDAVRSFLTGRADRAPLLDALVAGRHRAWRGFLDLKADGRVLCLGSGYGAVVEGLAPHCEQLFVLESVLSKLRFVRQRLAIFTPNDDAILLAGSLDVRLPFRDGSFDCVIMAEPPASGGPGGMLPEIRRVLRDKGQVLLLADNRFSLSLPAGWDGGSGAQSISGLARACGLIARWWKKSNGPQSLRGLRRQISSAGLTDVEAFGLWPARDQVDEIVPLQNDPPVALPGEDMSWKQRLRRHGFFLPVHCFIAQAGGGRRRSLYDGILAAVARELPGIQEDPPLRALRHIMTRKDKMIIEVVRGAELLVLRIPFSSAAAAAEERHAAMLARIETSHHGLAPKPLATGLVDGIVYHAETALPGWPLNQLLPQRGSVEVLARVDGLLEVMNPTHALRRTPLEGPTYERLIDARLDRVFPLVPNPDWRTRLRAWFRSHLYGANLPLGLVHGDFSGSNIYLAGSSGGILDWEAAAFDDLPILDAIGYLESALRPLNPTQSLADRLHALAQRHFPSAAEEHFLFDRYQRLGIDPGYHAGLVYLRWLRQIDHLVPYWLSYDPVGQERYINQMIRLMLDSDAAG